MEVTRPNASSTYDRHRPAGLPGRIGLRGFIAHRVIAVGRLAAVGVRLRAHQPGGGSTVVLDIGCDEADLLTPSPSSATVSVELPSVAASVTVPKSYQPLPKGVAEAPLNVHAGLPVPFSMIVYLP